ncbi:G patch domain-containing protein 1 homolog [Sabethes cyaneus]|uniref:G patch domain-containing protein 1 homolog n=1 Tax=Sabethes cyaneus TaxID=53552 RepID=UPI00237D89ED|nr:G patch domain-containing protein 1 homolog [Sabethes cyaneus]
MEDNEEIFCKYGTPLPSYGEDEIPAKKPVSVEDQIVLDVNGKRRFHGAFTGGFSAGYWNTVGSEEGWRPTEFKSSRKDKGTFKLQNPMDFMDDEDLGEFGIAPQRVQAKEDFAHCSKGVKRSIAQINMAGPIPGQPVLKSLLRPAKEKTAVCILKKMGWREGQGIGDRQSRTAKKKTRERNKKEEYVMKMYGCALPTVNTESNSSTDSESDFSDYEVTFAPDDFDPLVAAIKQNTFGLGYCGLQREAASGFNLFDTLEVVDQNNKKLSIRGQAFGVGALEDDDEDIYAKDDMSKYDFSLENGSKKTTIKELNAKFNCLEGFCPKKITCKQSKKVYNITIPENFIPRNWVKRFSRFEPLDEKRAKNLEKKEHHIHGLGRHDMTPIERSHVLGETQAAESKSSENIAPRILDRKTEIDAAAKIFHKGSSCEQVKQNLKGPLLSNFQTQMSNLGSTKEGFKPFITDPDKQDRYEQFILFKPNEQYSTNRHFLASLQPLGMSEWDRERELNEFVQAQRMYRPMDGLMSDRFVTESSIVAEKQIESSTKTDIKMRRSKSMWKPNKDLCKRFNVPEPFGGTIEKEIEKPKIKFSVFDYLETPINNKSNFVTPVVIPQSSAKLVEYAPVRESTITKFIETDIPSTSSAGISRKPLVSNEGTIKVIEKKPAKQSKLELIVLECVNKKPEEKKDLFQSIFCSSDEEDSNDEQVMEKSEASSMTASEKLKLVESLVAIKPASEINVLRNDSPPRGIFKSILEIKVTPQSLGTKAPQQPVSAESSSHSARAGVTEEYYGPKLPDPIAVKQSILPTLASNEALDARLEAAIKKCASHGVVEKWIEKDSAVISKSKKKKNKDHKKSKKHKKEKKKSKR